MLNKIWIHFRDRVIRDKRGFFEFIPAIASTISSGIKLFGGDGGDANIEGFKPPEFFQDPIFKETQTFLKDFGIDILGGKVPDFFKPIGEVGGKEFEDVLKLSNRDIQKSILDTAAITGRGRGGGVTEQIGERIAENTTKARFNDFLRAIGGRKFLFREGRGITEGVRSSALTNQGQKNDFNLEAAGIDLDFRKLLDGLDAREGAAKGRALTSFVSGISDLGTEIERKFINNNESNLGLGSIGPDSAFNIQDILNLLALSQGGV